LCRIVGAIQSFLDNLISQQQGWKPKYWMTVLTMPEFVALMVSGLYSSSQLDQIMKDIGISLEYHPWALEVRTSRISELHMWSTGIHGCIKIVYCYFPQYKY
jgi:hypothetical protein